MNVWLKETLGPLELSEPLEDEKAETYEDNYDPPPCPTLTVPDDISSPEVKSSRPRLAKEDKQREDLAAMEESNADQESVLEPIRTNQDLLVKKIKKQRMRPTGREFLVKFFDSKVTSATLKAWPGHYKSATLLPDGQFNVVWYDYWAPEADVGADLRNNWDAERNRPRKRRRKFKDRW
jgi:hypothetical protein